MDDLFVCGYRQYHLTRGFRLMKKILSGLLTSNVFSTREGRRLPRSLFSRTSSINFYMTLIHSGDRGTDRAGCRHGLGTCMDHHGAWRSLRSPWRKEISACEEKG